MPETSGRAPRKRKQLNKTVRGLIGSAVFLALWELACRTGLLDTRFVPAPSWVAGEIVHLFRTPEFTADFVATVLAWLIALVIAVVIAVPAGLLLGSLPGLRGATVAVVEFLRPIPAVVLIPPAEFAFASVGSGDEGAQVKIILAAFASVWPILFNVMYGVQGVDPQFVDTAKAFHTGRLRTALGVRLPYVVPFALTGIRVAAAAALIVTVSTEFLTNSGIGFGSYIVLNGQTNGDTPMVVTGVVLAGLLGYLVNGALQAAQNRLCSWSVEGAR